MYKWFYLNIYIYKLYIEFFKKIYTNFKFRYYFGNIIIYYIYFYYDFI